MCFWRLRREDLKLSTPRNSRVLSGVDVLLRTLKENPEEDPKVRAMIQFSVSLFEELQIIVVRNVQSGNKRSKELYGPYHAFVTSSLYIAWEQLEGQLQEKFDPSVPQLIADSYLHAAIKEAADTLPSPSRSPAVRQLSEIEENAIMYAAGYVVRVLMENYKEAVGPVAADFMACLLNMLEGSSLDIEQNESFEECAARWVKLTNVSHPICSAGFPAGR